MSNGNMFLFGDLKKYGVAEELDGRQDGAGRRARDHHRLLPAAGVRVGVRVLLINEG